MEKIRVYRSVSDRMVGGVCGGLGTFLNIDPIFVRLLFVLLLFGSDFGFILYLLLWIIIPEEGKSYGFKDDSFGDKVKSMGDDIQQALVGRGIDDTPRILGHAPHLIAAPQAPRGVVLNQRVPDILQIVSIGIVAGFLHRILTGGE